MVLNFRHEEKEMLADALEGSEFWCTDCDHDGGTKACGECQKYLEWEKLKGSLKTKLDNAMPSFGAPRTTPERRLSDLKWKRTLAEIRIRKLEEATR